MRKIATFGTLAFNYGKLRVGSETAHLAGRFILAREKKINSCDIKLAQQQNRAWNEKHKLMEPSYLEKVEAEIGMALYSPTIKRRDFFTMNNVFSWMLAEDDALDRWENLTVTPNEINQLFLFMMDGLRNQKRLNWAAYPKLQQFTPLYTSICDIGKTLASNKNMDLEEFFGVFESFLASSIEELEVKTKDQRPTTGRAYLDNKAPADIHDFFYSLNIAMLGLQNPSEVTNHPLFCALRMLSNELFIISNDICSIRRDLEEKGLNYILIRQKELGCTLQEALDQSLKEYNDKVCQALELEAILAKEKPFKSSAIARLALTQLLDMTQGICYWFYETERYNKNSELVYSKNQAKTEYRPIDLSECHLSYLENSALKKLRYPFETPSIPQAYSPEKIQLA